MQHQALVPRLSDDLVTLDAHRVEDVAAHLAGEDDETARRFGWWPDRSTAETVLSAYGDWSEDWSREAPRRTFAVRDPADGRLVGGCALRVQSDRQTGHVSYWTHQNERGRGRSPHALTLLAEYAKTLGLNRLESHVEHDNLASARVSERAGFARESAYTDGDGRAMVVYVRALS